MKVYEVKNKEVYEVKNKEGVVLFSIKPDVKLDEQILSKWNMSNEDKDFLILKLIKEIEEIVIYER